MPACLLCLALIFEIEKKIALTVVNFEKLVQKTSLD
jgi:hypothetical protein